MIRFEGFGKRYGEVVAVHDLTLTIAPGEVVALLGHNGSGKTTSLKAAAGLVRPSAGQVRVGAELRPALEPRARAALSYLPQKVAFAESLTGREVVRFHARLRGMAEARVEEVLALARLTAAADRAVGGYSGGMVQRLGLAVAAVPEALILLFDEPTASLDSEGLAAFHGLVQAQRQAGRTVLFTSHQAGDAAQLADRVVRLVDGRMVHAEEVA